MDLELTRMFLKRQAGLALFVGVVVGILAGGLGAMFPDMPVEDAQSMASSWPALMKELFGDPLAGFTDIYAWLELEIFHVTLWLVLGTLASVLAVRIVAREVEQRTLDILLSIPRSRGVILTSRLLALSTLLVAAAVPIAAGCCAAIVVRGQPLELVPVALSTLAAVLLALVLANVALHVSIWIPRQVPAVAITMGVAGLCFISEEMLIHVMPWLKAIAFVNPFHWYETADILVRGVLSPWSLLMLLAMSLSYASFSILAFTLRDVPV